MKRIVFCMLALALLNQCTLGKSSSETKLSIKLPEKKTGFTSRKLVSKTAQSLSTTTLKSSLWGLQSQSTIDEADCYAIYIQSSDLESGSCISQDDSTVVPISRLFGFFSAGQTISIDVPSGNNRTLGIFALMSQDGTCGNATDTAFDPRKYSKPILVGSVTQNLNVGENTLNLDISMTNAIPIESCTGTSFQQFADAKWPNCTAEASGVNYQNGEIKVSGYCMGNTTSVNILNTSTSQKTELSLIEKTNTDIRLRPTSAAMSISAKTLYRLLISTAQGATTEVPFSLSLETVMTFPELKDSSGNVIGEMINSGGIYYGGNLINVYAASGELISYYSYTGNLDTSKLYLMPAFILLPASLSGASPRQAGRNGILFSVNNNYYFSGPNCTGDILVPANYNTTANDQLKGNIVVQPKGCIQDTSNGQWSCTGYDYFRLSGQGTLNSNTNMTWASSFSMNWGSSVQNGSFAYCYNSTDVNSTSTWTNTSFFRFNESQKVPFAAGDVATTLINASINLR